MREVPFGSMPRVRAGVRYTRRVKMRQIGAKWKKVWFFSFDKIPFVAVHSIMKAVT
jgi:hypothetical protein